MDYVYVRELFRLCHCYLLPPCFFFFSFFFGRSLMLLACICYFINEHFKAPKIIQSSIIQCELHNFDALIFQEHNSLLWCQVVFSPEYEFEFAICTNSRLWSGKNNGWKTIFVGLIFVITAQELWCKCNSPRNKWSSLLLLRNLVFSQMSRERLHWNKLIM